MFRNRSVSIHEFSMVPRADIPRSRFKMEKSYKTAFDASALIPVMCEEVLPGDTFNVRATMFARLATPIYPIMDNMYLESFFFFVPNRLVWNNWVKFMGEQTNPADSISFTIPQMLSPAGGFAIGSLGDYFGLPTVGTPSITGQYTFSALPFRAYQLIYNQWFRDENTHNSITVIGGAASSDGPDPTYASIPPSRLKRHDYFTSCLPWTQKGGVAITIPLGTVAPVRTKSGVTVSGQGYPIQWASNLSVNVNAVGNLGGFPGLQTLGVNTGTNGLGQYGNPAATSTVGGITPMNLEADLSTATAATINQLRQSFQIQKLLERDARGGTRYTELVRSHFGVMSPDSRLQRPEYLGGGSSRVSISAIAQTTATGLTGGSTPLGQLSAFGTVTAMGHGFSQSFVEHGYVIGVVMVRADLTYQQGLRRHWSRSTRYDYYWPVFATLGEQAVLNKEIYLDGSANDALVFGYQERWAEYRYNPSQITGVLRSTASGTLDPWHLAEKFSALPALSSGFFTDGLAVVLDRAIAVPSQPQFIFDSLWEIVAARPMPMYSVPGLIDHF